MTSTNDITGDLLQTKNTTDDYRSGWDRIFGNKSNMTPTNSIKLKHKKGYVINVTTYENDGDNTKTCSVWTSDEKSMRFIVDICKLFNKSQYDFVNLYEEEEDTYEEVYNNVEIIANHLGITSIAYSNKKFNTDNIDDLLRDLEIMDRSEYWYLGYVSSFNVEYYKDDVYYEEVNV